MWCEKRIGMGLTWVAGRYDAAGNMVDHGAYVFDAENRIKSGGGATYSYDGDGNRVAKSGAGGPHDGCRGSYRPFYYLGVPHSSPLLA